MGTSITVDNLDVYLYGMTVFSTIHLLDGSYPEPDSYREIKETYRSKPDEKAIQSAKIVSLDPFFQEESKLVAAYCKKTGKPYVTIDCAPDSELNINAAATIISNEFITNEFPKEDIRKLLETYTNMSEGLVIFTFGSREILYGRKGKEIRSIIPYKVDVKGTLGAGDTFRAGVVYGVLNQMDDENIVKFAAATAAAVCARFPMALNPPGLEDIMGLVRGTQRNAL